MSRKSKTGGHWHSDPDYFRTAKAPGPLEGLKVGDKVQFTKYFLKSIGCGPTNPEWRRVGVVVEMVSFGKHDPGPPFPRVKWDGSDEPVLVNPANLALHGVPSLRSCE